MGEVYRARDERLGREVAVKVLREDALADPERQHRFALEARAASALNHPNILTVFDVGMQDGVPYIVTELIGGESLAAFIGRGPVPRRKALDLAIQIARGLAAAHQAGIVHRDLKPANVMVAGDGLAKILDFGLAKSVVPPAAVAGAPSRDTAPGFIVGTATYMSPEQVKGEALDHRTDQFSFGLLLYEMLAGKAAFARGSAVGAMAAIVDEPAPSLAEINPAVSPPIRWCVERCLEKDREGRYAATVDLKRELEIIRLHLDETIAPAALVQPSVPPRSRRRWLPGAILGLAGLAVGALAAAALLVPSAADLAAVRLRPVAVAGEFARSPVFSHDGKSIVFTAAINGVREVFVRELESPMAAQITNSAADCQHPFWSPDDSRIFFLRAGASATDLFAVGATGGSPEVVEPNVSAAAIGAGNTLGFLRADPTGKDRLSLWIADGDPRNPRRYAGPPFDSGKYQLGYLAFSPDGKSLGVWLSAWDGSSEFWLVPWTGGQARRTFSMGLHAFPFSWMPDGRHAVFGGEVPGSYGSDLQLVETGNGRLRPLTSLTKDAVEASVSPDGRRIVFVAAEDNFDLLSVPLDGSPARTLYGSDRNEFDPAWAPDGDQIAYCTDRTGVSEIWLRSARYGWDRPVVTAKNFGDAPLTEFREPNISPDGRRMTYSAADKSGHSIYISSVAGGRPVPLSTEKVDELSPSWNGDGSWISYLRNNGGSWSLVKAASGGNSKPIVLREGCLPSRPRWNRGNSHWIACVTNEGLTIVSEDGAESRPLSKEHWLVFGWSRDGKILNGIKETAARRRVISSIEIETGAEKVLGELPLPLAAEVRGFSLAPDGASFATSASHPSGGIWTLEGFRQPGLLSWLRR